MVITYEIYETSLRRVSLTSYEMTTSVKFCLLYDPLKLDFIALKLDTISRGKRIVDTELSITLRLCAKVLLYVWS